MTLTLLSDFGHQDNFVGVTKGIILQQLPQVQIIDLSHEVMPFHMLQCSYYLKSAFAHFPVGTIHLSLFDIMRHNPSMLLVAEVEGQYVLSADNGLLPLTFPTCSAHVYKADFKTNNYLNWIRETALFIKEWETQDFSLAQLTKAEAFKGPYSLEPYVNQNSIECQIIHVDKYGNVVMNLTEQEFEFHRKNRKFIIHFSRTDSINKISVDYSSVPEGESLCRFNSGNFLELAIHKGSAAQLFGLSVIRDHQLIYQKIKIDFI